MEDLSMKKLTVLLIATAMLFSTSIPVLGQEACQITENGEVVFEGIVRNGDCQRLVDERNKSNILETILGVIVIGSLISLAIPDKSSAFNSDDSQNEDSLWDNVHYYFEQNNYNTSTGIRYEWKF